MKKCVIQAEGCFIYFAPKVPSSVVCTNIKCIKIRRNNLNKKNQLKLREEYKMGNKERIYRSCLGLYCRGKKFWAIGGARICNICKAAIDGMENDEPQRIVFW